MEIARLATQSSQISSITNLTSQASFTKHQRDFMNHKVSTMSNQLSLRRTTAHHLNQLLKRRDLKPLRKRRETKSNLRRKTTMSKKLMRNRSKRLRSNNKTKMMIL